MGITRQGGVLLNAASELSVITEYMDKIKAMVDELAPEGADADTVAAKAQEIGEESIELYRAANNVKKTINETIDESLATCKDMLAAAIVVTGRTEWKTPFGMAYIPKPSTSVRYDAKALDALCEHDAELAAKIGPFRKETERAGSLTIR